ncbi:hypothetical protein [Streptomyces cyanogenus]|uniref:Uncharacterized protein n=1 Tax=Streptomyces cyanogenus TaxID=80860 RepID=A0ABX7TV26_STRCY|nr:hypothetical protein [Streptomyces cyanogenus]QTD99120.1 hypothetical protein S1361_17350 [Streptomyces cyanogenus]
MDDELITERRPVAFPRVFGYLRRLTGGPARHSALVYSLTEFCRQHELMLCGVFTDRETTVAVRSPAFVGLLDALQLPGTYGAVVPALSHLGPKRLADERMRQMEATGTRLMTIRPTTLAAASARTLSPNPHPRPQRNS